MARQNVAFIAFNRGIISPKALARVDLERTQLSAETMTNWLPRTQGAMSIRPGTKYIGSSYNDTGAVFLEFIASSTETALIELTDRRMRVWVDDELVSRVIVTPSIDLADASSDSIGGTFTSAAQDHIPVATAQTTANVEITASSSNVVADFGGQPWRVADDDYDTEWHDTGDGHSTVPSWLNVDYIADDTADTGLRVSIRRYSVRNGAEISTAPKAWRLITGNFDTGTYATDTGKWTLEDERSAQVDWELWEERLFTLPGNDTGTVEARRHWRLFVTTTDTGAGGEAPERRLRISELSMFLADSASKTKIEGNRYILNATAIGSLARSKIAVQVDTGDIGVEHGFESRITRGPITVRVGSTSGGDDYITNTVLGTGYHNIAFTPTTGFFHVTMQTDARFPRIIGSAQVADSGPVVLTTPWTRDQLSSIRFDQSADVIYASCAGVKTHKIQRHGNGRSWSIVEFEPVDGPFVSGPSSEARLSVNLDSSAVRLLMKSDIPFFKREHIGALMRLTHNGQSGLYLLGALDATTEAVELVGVGDTGDTGSPSQSSERRLDAAISGTYTGTVTIERSFDGPDFGFHPVSTSGGYLKPTNGSAASPTDTGTCSFVVNDPDDNVTAWYRVRLSSYTSGVALVRLTYHGLSTTGVARILDFNNSREVDIEAITTFSDSGSTDVWEEGLWSGVRGYPNAVALHGGRLAFAKGAQLALSASDDFENFDDLAEGDAAPILRTLGSGPVDSINFLLPLLRLVIGTTGSEIALRSSSLDEPVTPTNSSARAFSTQGSAELRAIKVDSRGLFVQRSGRKMFSIGSDGESLEGEYGLEELTALVPDLMVAGVVSIAVQRQPDTRIHCVLADGTVAILTVEPVERVLCWSLWEGDTGTGAAVERAMVLPGVGEDAVYYHIRRTINGTTKRYLERWATEDECAGDTGLTFLMDSAAVMSATDSGVQKSGALHLRGEQVVVVAQDTGQATAMRDLSPDVAGVQDTYTVGDSGIIILDTGNFTNIVAGLPYKATWKSSKLAYATEQGQSALAQLKRTDKIGFILHTTHNNALFFGNDTGQLDALPRVIAGATVDPDTIFDTLDQVAMPFPGLWYSDSRIVLRGKSPRPVTVLAGVPTVTTNDKL